MKSVRDLGEFGLIKHIQRQLGAGPAVLGIGDDCAVLAAPASNKYLLFACDPVVEQVHYRQETPPQQVGWKAMARNLSDIAAMGGTPLWVVVSIGLRPETPVAYVDQLYRGLKRAAAKFGCTIVGGDTTHVVHEPFVVVTILGEVERKRLLRRQGVRTGDAVFVTGRLGGSINGKHLRFTPRIREAQWLAKHVPIHAMIDISDGLAGDLHRLIDANDGRVGFRIFADQIPVAAAAADAASALTDGEDFELLFTVAPQHAAALVKKWRRRFKLELTRIGEATRDRGRVTVVGADGTTQLLPAGGYDHFSNR